MGVQVVGGLVDERKAPLPEEQDRQKGLGPFPVGEGGKGPPQGLFLHPQEAQLLGEAPALRIGTEVLQHLRRQALRLRDGTGEIVEGF